MEDEQIKQICEQFRAHGFPDESRGEEFWLDGNGGESVDPYLTLKISVNETADGLVRCRTSTACPDGSVKYVHEHRVPEKQLVHFVMNQLWVRSWGGPESPWFMLSPPEGVLSEELYGPKDYHAPPDEFGRYPVPPV